MQEFKLPLLTGTSEFDSAFRAMVEFEGASVSGIVIRTPTDYRLLHYRQVHAALEGGVELLADIPGYIDLGTESVPIQQTGLALPIDFQIVGISPNSIVIRSRRETGALMFLAPNPAYRCNGPGRHVYPPNQPAPFSDRCTVLNCPGTLPI